MVNLGLMSRTGHLHKSSTPGKHSPKKRGVGLYSCSLVCISGEPLDTIGVYESGRFLWCLQCQVSCANVETHV